MIEITYDSEKGLTVNELFSGIGAQRKALERMGVLHEVVGICEIDKYAIQSYEAIFGPTYNYGDISKVPRLEYADLWTYSFPCQDISIAGNQKGINENTRSGLLYEVQRLLEVAEEEETLPKYLLLENVKNLVGNNFKAQFDEWLAYLDELGYNNYWKVLNAKDYGIPQNRERVFVMSIRKDVDNGYSFPIKETSKVRLADVLEDVVEEKFYLSEDKVSPFVEKLSKDNYAAEKIVCEQRTDVGLRFFQGGVCGTLRTIDACGDKRVIQIKNSPVRLGNIYGESRGTGFAGNVWDKNAVSPTLTTMEGGNRQPMIMPNELRIRKLTPLECWRLMGFDDEDFFKAQRSGVSNSQLYKQAGNSIVVNVLEKIFTELLFREMI